MAEVTKSVRIDNELRQRARAKALNEGKTMQNLIRDLLTEFLKKGGK